MGEPDDPAGEALDSAWDELEEGRPLEALEILSGLGEELPERWLVECAARRALGEIDAAERALARAERGLGRRDPDVLWNRGELELTRWRLDQAHAAFERLRSVAPGPEVLDRLALLADLRGDHASCDRLLAEARRLDPELAPPPRLSPSAFEAVVREAAEKLPPKFRELFESVPVVIDPVPERALAESGPPGETPPDLLGLFLGPSLLDRSVEGLDFPAAIHLFQRNLERGASSRAELMEEIRITLYHELGHALGFDESGVESMGLD